MRRLHDPNTGAMLERVVLQITERDERGRVTHCRLRHDDETINLGEDGRREFLIVWVDAKQQLGRFRLANEEAELADLLRESQSSLVQARAQIASTRKTMDLLEEDNRVKTEALRRLNDERDPKAIEDRVAVAVNAATLKLEHELAAERARHADLRREADELRASKRKLREALERAKEGRR